MKISLGYITAANKKEAKDIVVELLERGLIVCANIIPGAESYFVWEDEISKASEVVVVIKTRTKNESKIIKRVRKLHSYDCPCVVFTPIANGDGDFCRWINENC